jgi:hypothetical protein
MCRLASAGMVERESFWESRAKRHGHVLLVDKA